MRNGQREGGMQWIPMGRKPRMNAVRNGQLWLVAGWKYKPFEDIFQRKQECGKVQKGEMGRFVDQSAHP
jgi:hypothetical protein